MENSTTTVSASREGLACGSTAYQETAGACGRCWVSGKPYNPCDMLSNLLIIESNTVYLALLTVVRECHRGTGPDHGSSCPERQ